MHFRDCLLLLCIIRHWVKIIIFRQNTFPTNFSPPVSSGNINRPLPAEVLPFLLVPLAIRILYSLRGAGRTDNRLLSCRLRRSRRRGRRRRWRRRRQCWRGWQWRCYRARPHRRGGRRALLRGAQVMRRVTSDGRDATRSRRRVHHGVVIVTAAVSVVRRGSGRGCRATAGRSVVSARGHRGVTADATAAASGVDDGPANTVMTGRVMLRRVQRRMGVRRM